MGWSLGYDVNWHRDVGYSVPAVCDDPECNKTINRGLSHVCGGEPFGGDYGCGLYFCRAHLLHNEDGRRVCRRCIKEELPYDPKPDTREWLEWKLTDPSWEDWRRSNPDQVAAMQASITPVIRADTNERENGRG